MPLRGSLLRGVLLGTFLSVAASVAAAPAAPTAAPADTVQMVEYFLKAPTGDLPAEKVPDFLAVDPATLPAKLRPGWAAKREELLALKKIAEGGRKPPVRRMGVPAPSEKDCLPVVGPEADKPFRAGPFMEIYDAEVRYLSGLTKCSECELMTEFTLTNVVKTHPKAAGKKPREPERFYFVHERDPLSALVGVRRKGIKNPFGSNFFGLGAPSCH